MKTLIFSIICLLCIASPCFAYTLTATETARGAYSDGYFEEGEVMFSYKYEVDEEDWKVTRTEITNLSSKMPAKDETVYKITATHDASGQKRITAVGNPGYASTEIIQIGKDKFTTCKAVDGHVVVSSGTVKKE